MYETKVGDKVILSLTLPSPAQAMQCRFPAPNSLLRQLNEQLLITTQLELNRAITNP